LIGHGHPRHREAIARALDSGILHTGTRLPSPERAALYHALSKVLPVDRQTIHLANSGAEAVETAIKAAMFATGRRRIIAFEGGYHGRTLGALCATHAPHLREPFVPASNPWVTFCPYATRDDEAAFALQIFKNTLAAASDIAMVIVEAVQGVSGVRGPSPVFLQGVAQAAHDCGALVIADEIWSGLGRSGRWFAFEHAGLAFKPDIIVLGKGLSASLPLSAVAASNDVLGRWPPGLHTSTFQGNPLACAAAVATLSTLRDECLPDRAQNVLAPLMRRALEPLVGQGICRQVKVVGAQAAIDVGNAATAQSIQRAALDQQLLVYGGGCEGECVMLLPPLNIDTTLLQDALNIVVGLVTAASE
ncbi:MAG: aspartate aminotransferase family protein, partial [Pseudomonadota bacterium]